MPPQQRLFTPTSNTKLWNYKQVHPTNYSLQQTLPTTNQSIRPATTSNAWHGCCHCKICQDAKPSYCKNVKLDANIGLSRLHLDKVSGLMTSVDGFKGFAVIGDDWSRYRCVIFFRAKSDVSQLVPYLPVSRSSSALGSTLVQLDI